MRIGYRRCATSLPPNFCRSLGLHKDRDYFLICNFLLVKFLLIFH